MRIRLEAVVRFVLSALSLVVFLAPDVPAQGAPLEPPAGSCFSDLHNSALYRLFRDHDIAGLEREDAAVSLRGIRAVNTRFLFFSIGIPRYDLEHPGIVTIGQILAFLDSFRSHAEDAYPDLAFAGNRRGLHAALRAGKTAFAFALESSHLLEGDVAVVDSLYAAGVRMLAIAHWFHNEFIEPAPQAKEKASPFIDDDSILSPLGVALLERMITLGMIVDVSHLRKTSLRQVVKIVGGRTGLVASHSNARSVHDTPRNLSDQEVGMIVESNGLIGVSLHRSLVASGENANVEALVDHIVHLLGVTGAKHVALGTDYEGGITPVAGLEKIEHMRKLAAEMRRRGLSELTISDVLCENVLDMLPD